MSTKKSDCIGDDDKVSAHASVCQLEDSFTKWPTLKHVNNFDSEVGMFATTSAP